MDWSSVLNVILIPTLTGLGGLVVWLVKFYIPTIEKRKDAELQAKLENHKDKREHSQAQESIAIDILRDIIAESSKESTEMRKAIERLGKQVDNNTQANRSMAGIISEKLDGENKSLRS